MKPISGYSQSNGFRLLRAILIDSYSPGHAVEIKLDGHTTINGRNAAGKTTLLRLLPIFLGESPSRIIRSSSSTDNFSRHYFPTLASYVIFEYQRRDQKALAVIHGDGQRESVVYRFINSGYEERLFYEDGNVIQSNDLYRHLNKISVECTKDLSLSAYRQVLQNNASREYRHLTTHYSLVGSGGRLNHLERVISGILQRVTTFDDLRRMVISSVQDEDRQFALSTGRAELRKWIEEFQAHQALMDKSPVMESIEQAEIRRKEVVAQLSEIHTKFITLQRFQELQKQEAESALEKARSDRQLAEKEYGNKLQALNDEKNGFESQAKSAKQQLETIEQRHQLYQQNKIDENCAKVDSIPTLDDNLSRLRGQHQKLVGAFSDIAKAFENLQSQEQQAAQLEKSKLEERKSTIWQEFQLSQERTRSAHQLSMEAITEAQNAEISALQTAQSKVAAAVAVHKERIANNAGDPELKLFLDEAQKELESRGDDLNKAIEAARSAERESSTARQKFESGEMQFNEANSAHENSERAFEKLRALQSAGDDTLLGFMRSNKPEWAANIGRVINEDLLLRKDLVPDVAEGESLYGISIDLEKIAVGRLADEEVFRRELARAEERLKLAEQAVRDDEAALQLLSEKREQAQQVCKTSEIAVTQAQSAKRTTEARVTSLRNQYAASRKSGEDVAKAALQQHQAEMDKITRDITILQAEHRKNLQEMQADQQSEIEQGETHREQLFTQIRQQQASIDEKLAEKNKLLSEERNASLAQKGIDPSALERLGNEISQIVSDLETARKNAPNVSQYRTWIDSVWSTRPVLQAEHAEFSAKTQSSLRAIDTLLQERLKVYQTIDELIKSNEESANRSGAFLRIINGHIESLAAYQHSQDAASLPYDRANTLQSLAEQKARGFESLKQEMVAIATGIEDIRRVMINRPNTRPEQYHGTSVKERGSPMPGLEYEWLDVMRGWFNSEHLVHRTSLLQLAKTMAMNISAFWTSLNDFKKKVASFERELRSSLDQGALFDRIAEVDVQISTDLDKQDYWEAIERLHMEYETWHAQGESALPPDGFVSAATEVVAILNDDKGLVANPIDLLRIKVAATVNGRHVVATNEHELETMSSTGLSYIVLCVVLVGFVNRIRGNQQVAVPWPVDELRDLDFENARTLIELLTRNNIVLVAAFPDVDADLAPLFDRNYKILDGRKVGIIKLNESSKDLEKQEAAYV